jgi:prephenate dehydrogenase
LIESIISNPEVRKYNEEFWKDLNMLSALAQDKKTDEIQNYIRASQEKISKNVDLDKSYRKLSAMFNSASR